MKKLYIYTAALLMLAGTFTSCTKELDDVGLNASSIDAAKKEVTVQNTNKKVDSGLYLSFSNPNPVVGETITLTAAFTKVINAGKVRIQVPDATEEGGWRIVAEAAISANTQSVTYNFSSSTAGTFNFRAQYVPSNGANFNQVAVENSVTYTATCNGATLTTSLVYATPVTGTNLTEYKVAFRLTSCTAYSKVKLQGGISATIEGNVIAMSSDGVAGNVRYNTNNAVINWENLNVTDSYNNIFYVTFRKIAKAGEELTGDWTAKSGEEEIASSPEFSLSN